MSEIPMKGLTLTQPWATEMALGHKAVETRSWPTRYRGLLAIHAAKGFPADARIFAEEERALGRIPERLPLGAIVAVVAVKNCLPTTEALRYITPLEKHLGYYDEGRWAWATQLLYTLSEPIPCRGALGLWELPGNVREQIVAQWRLDEGVVG